MKRGVASLLGFLGGAIVGWSLSIAAYVVLTSAGFLFDRDGGIAMAFAFTIGPVLGLVLGIVGAVWARRRAESTD
jgi:Flp pilus assembly protein TadG